MATYKTHKTLMFYGHTQTKEDGKGIQRNLVPYITNYIKFQVFLRRQMIGRIHEF